MRAASLRPDAVGARQRRLVLRAIARAAARPASSADSTASATPGADALHGRQQAEPVALGGVDEAVEVDVVLADMRLDQQPRRRARRRQAAPACGVEQKTR